MSTYQHGSAVTLPPSLPLTQNTAPVKEFKCLYTHDKRQKKKRWQDGFLRYHSFNKRVMVYDDTRNFVGDMHYTDSGEICEGDDLVFEAFLVQVSEYTKTVQQDLTPIFTPKLRRREAIHQGTSAAFRSTPIARTPAQPRPFQSQVQRGPPQAMTPQTPLSQLKAKSLSGLVGVAKGPQGRALLPAFSPFEERRQMSDDTRRGGQPSKRQKRSSPTTKNVGNDMDGHVVPVVPERTGAAEAHVRPLWYRTACRWEQRDVDEDGPSRITQQPTPHSKELSRERQSRESPYSSKLVLQEANQQTRPPVISINSDPEPMEDPYKPGTDYSRGTTKSPKARKEKTPPLHEKYPLQPLRILATHSSRKTKLLCQEAPPKPPNCKVDSRIRSHHQQQARLQGQMQNQHYTRKNFDLSGLTQAEDGPDISHGADDISEQREQGEPAPPRSPPPAGRRKHNRIGRVGPLPGHKGIDWQQLAAEKATSASVTAESPMGKSRSNPQGNPDQPVRSRQERKSKLLEQSNKFQQSVSRIAKPAAHSPNTFGSGRSVAVEESADDPWSKEATDLFDWHPPSKMGNDMGTGLFLSQG